MSHFRCYPEKGPLLVILPSVPAAIVGDGFLLDEKALSGLRKYHELWPGPIRCIFRSGSSGALQYPVMCKADDLPFMIEIIAESAIVPDELLSDAAVALASGDAHQDLELAERFNKFGTPIVYVIEYILETRIQIIWLEKRSVYSRLKSIAWVLLAELRRRKAFKRAQGLQANGMPATRAYRALSNNLLTFFDTRLGSDMLASDASIANKAHQLKSGEPLRLAFSGRLEPLKGADDLIPIAERLASLGVHFTLDIFGDGSNRGKLLEQIQYRNLGDYVKLHGAVDFSRVLVPYFQEHIDIFLCCHRQSDPSCTYMEAMGCGVAFLGFANRALTGLLEQGNVGLAVPMGSVNSLAEAIQKIDKSRDELIAMMRAARDLSARNDVDQTFANRTSHLIGVACAPQ